MNQTKSALYIFNGFIPFRTAVGKFICAGIAIGSGQSLGPEDPSLQIGASIASALGRQLEISREKLRLMAPVGAAAGLAAAFNAPISAVLFVIEEVIGRWSAGILGSVVLSAVASVVVVRSFLGSEPLFRIPVTTFKRPSELIAYAVLGIVGGLASVAFAKSIGYFRPILKALPRWTQYLQPAVAGLLVGFIGFLGFPQVMGAGYDSMDQAMHGQYAWKVLAHPRRFQNYRHHAFLRQRNSRWDVRSYAFYRSHAWWRCRRHRALLFSPTSPALLEPTSSLAWACSSPDSCASPMTSVFMVLEVSGNYEIIVPVIVANTFSYLVSRSLQTIPIFDLLTRQDGLILPSLEEEREETILRVEDAMLPVPDAILSAQDYVDANFRRVQNSADATFLVRMHPSGWSTVDREQLQRLYREGKGELTLASVLPPQSLPSLYPDLPLDSALHYVNDYPLIPVVNRADSHRLEGVVSRESVFKKYGSRRAIEVPHDDAL